MKTSKAPVIVVLAIAACSSAPDEAVVPAKAEVMKRVLKVYSATVGG